MKPLRYADPNGPGISRRRDRRGFAYFAPDGSRLSEPARLARIRALVIPPAWKAVWISPDPAGHIQAMGKDERGRRQYIYHPGFRAERDAAKYARLVDFARILPGLRQTISTDMAAKGLPRRKVVATVVHLLDRTLIRIGNKAYAEQNKSFGLSTLRNRHVAVTGTTVRFAFKGKSGKEWSLAISDRRVARIIRACQDLPGQQLFQYVDDDGRRTIDSDDVNAYLREVTGEPISAKDFRTWAGTVLSAVTLAELTPAPGQAGQKRQLATAIRAVAKRLGNTPAVCRACYVHPAMIEAFADGSLRRRRRALTQVQDGSEGLSPAERAVLALIKERGGRPAGARVPHSSAAPAPARRDPGSEPDSQQRPHRPRAARARPESAGDRTGAR